jgi:hypothetical protein
MTTPSFHSPLLPGFADSFEIAGRKIGGGAPCYVIAEAGSITRQLARRWRWWMPLRTPCDPSNSDLRRREIGSNYSSSATALPRICINGKTCGALCNCALPDEFHSPCRTGEGRKIAFFSSAFSERDVDRLMKVEQIKIASFELVHLPLISMRQHGIAADHLHGHGRARRYRARTGSRDRGRRQQGGAAALRLQLSA